jgi:acetyl esterase/lipase
MKRLLVLLLLAGAAFAADIQYESVEANISFAAVNDLPFRDSDYTLAYGDSQFQFGKLWIPDTALPPKALLVLIHGGCWLNEFSIDHTFAFSTGLAELGYAVWSLEYRRTGDPGGGWPGTFDDVVAGINFIDSLSTYGIDAESLVIMGHSAGGHLAVLAGSESGDLAVAPDLIVGLAAITDIVEYSKGSSSCETAVPAFMGGTVEDRPEEYLSANPASQTLHPNSYLLQGDLDEIVPLTQAQLPGAETRISRGASHFDWIHPGSAAFASLIRLLDESL